jgi:hypothetical protein
LNSRLRERKVGPVVSAVHLLMEFLMKTNMLMEEPYTLPVLVQPSRPSLVTPSSWRRLEGRERGDVKRERERETEREEW